MKSFFSFLIFTLLLLIPVHSYASVQLSPVEQEFLKNHPVIKLGTEKTWAPYVIVNPDGSISGYDAEILAKINQLTGADFQLTAGDWAEMQIKAEKKEIDGLATGGIHAERKKYLNFSDYYIELQKMLIVSLDNPKKIQTRADLPGKIIAIHGSNLVDVKLAAQYPEAFIMKLDSVKEVIEAVITGKADATFGNGSTLYYASQIGLPYLKMQFPTGSELRLAFGVRKDWPEAVSILNKGLRAIPHTEKLQIRKKWFSDFLSTPVKPEFVLSQEEKTYLDSLPNLKACISNEVAPFVFFNKDSQAEGVLTELLERVRKHTGIRIDMPSVPAEITGATTGCDLVISGYPQKSPNFLPTTPFLKLRMGILSHLNRSHTSSLQSFRNEKLAVPSEFLTSMQASQPALNLLPVSDIAEGLDLLKEQKVSGYLDIIETMEFFQKTGGYSKFHVVGEGSEFIPYSFYIAKDRIRLLTIFNRYLSQISEEDKTEIIKKWIPAEFEIPADNSAYYISAGIFLVILILAILLHIVPSKKYQQSIMFKNMVDENLCYLEVNSHDEITGISSLMTKKFTLTPENWIGKTLAEFYSTQKVHFDYNYENQLSFVSPSGNLQHYLLNRLDFEALKNQSATILFHDISSQIEKDQLKAEQELIQLKEQILSDMHDGVGSVLTTIRLSSELAMKNTSLQQTELMKISELSKDGLTELRFMMNTLSVEQLSWPDAVTTLKKLNALMVSASFKNEFSVQGELKEKPLSLTQFLSLIRFYKEAINNVIKHADADLVTTIIIFEQDLVELLVKDNGKGISPSETGNEAYGMNSLRTRADELGAELQITSQEGTEISLKIYDPA